MTQLHTCGMATHTCCPVNPHSPMASHPHFTARAPVTSPPVSHTPTQKHQVLCPHREEPSAVFDWFFEAARPTSPQEGEWGGALATLWGDY